MAAFDIPDFAIKRLTYNDEVIRVNGGAGEGIWKILEDMARIILADGVPLVNLEVDNSAVSVTLPDGSVRVFSGGLYLRTLYKQVGGTIIDKPPGTFFISVNGMVFLSGSRATRRLRVWRQDAVSVSLDAYRLTLRFKEEKSDHDGYCSDAECELSTRIYTKQVNVADVPELSDCERYADKVEIEMRDVAFYK